jgi:hypothetical protein
MGSYARPACAKNSFGKMTAIRRRIGQWKWPGQQGTSIFLFGALALLSFASGRNMVSGTGTTPFARLLTSSEPSPQLPKSPTASMYDWLIGDWEADVYDYQPDGSKAVNKGEWHFSWVLEGRAIQDVWIVPRMSDRSATTPPDNNRYGSTLRIYDPKLDAWRIYWFNPVGQSRSELIGRKVGNDIVHQGIDGDGSLIRWNFEDIKPDSFVWRGESSKDGGKTWQLGAKFVAHRVTSDER